MTEIEIQDLFISACSELGLDPANTNLFQLECRRRGLDPKSTTMAELDRDASLLWSNLRRPKVAV